MLLLSNVIVSRVELAASNNSNIVQHNYFIVNNNFVSTQIEKIESDVITVGNNNSIENKTV